jgi:hypothetical protein
MFPLVVNAQTHELKEVPEHLKTGFDSITAEDSYNYVEFLASDELEGRDTVSTGLAISRRYIISLYKLWGVKPAGDPMDSSRSYEQTVPVVITKPKEGSRLEMLTETSIRIFQEDVDFFVGRSSRKPGVVTAPVVFAGYAFTSEEPAYDDFDGIDLKGKIVIYLSGVPGEKSGESPFAKKGDRPMSRWRMISQISKKITEAGAVAALEIQDSGISSQTRYISGKRIAPEYKRVSVPLLSADAVNTPMFRISKAAALEIFAHAGLSLEDICSRIDKTLKPHSKDLENIKLRITLDADLEAATTANLLGMIEGSDPKLKDEYVVIGAHLDHFGMKEDGYVFNGADDNASGSAGVLEVAQAFALNGTRPKRSVIFAHWTGEEKGLLGSRYFVKYPGFPNGKIVAYINMDMIGRSMSVESAKRMGRYWGMNTDDMPITEETMKNLVIASNSAQAPKLFELTTQFNVDHVGLFCPMLQSKELRGGSDHAPFHAAKIPAAGFFTGMHDDYHTPSDTVDLIEPEKMAKIGKLVFLVTYGIADADERITWKDEE